MRKIEIVVLRPGHKFFDQWIVEHDPIAIKRDVGARRFRQHPLLRDWLRTRKRRRAATGDRAGRQGEQD